ncbi:Lar family restriction alleviation protein [Azospirillum sp.]|uniref:Lar family restriction alleviation protein n=1 Tax=Azospirillum sp. TaxID=34012 RepID=UPI003D70E7A5
MVKLLDCPFCGGEGHTLPPTCTKATPYDPAHRAFPVVRCGGCGCDVPGKDWDDTRHSAIAAWNRRAVSAPAVAPEVAEKALVDCWNGVNEVIATLESTARLAREANHPEQAKYMDARAAELREAVTASRSALSLHSADASGGGGWNFDMEAAPKDGTEVLICEYGDVFLARWTLGHDNIRDEDWACFMCDGYRKHFDATCWRPLPAPPAQQEG